MSINRQQKNIVNPYANEDIEYDYTTDKRNIFVISAIHECYLFSLNFPTQNQTLKLSVAELQALGVEKNTPDLTINGLDLRAYATLYPQNCRAVTNGDTTKLESIGDQSANNALTALVEKLEQRDQLHLYTTNSSPTAILPENVNDLSPSGAASRLIAINNFHSANYKRLIYKSLELEAESSLDDYQSVENLSLSVIQSSYVNSNNSVDIYDWRENCKPGQETNQIYYNTVDDKFYYTTRTDQFASKLYDSSFWGENQENMGDEVVTAIQTGVKQILKYTGRYSQENLNFVLSLGLGESNDLNKINFLSHLDIRPGSRWLHAVRISRKIIESLEQNNDAYVSYDDFEFVPLQKAQILLDPEKNKAANRNVIKASNLIINLPSATRALRYYHQQVAEEGIHPEDISGINLRRVAATIDGFIDDISLVCVYNKFALDDDDIIEFFYTEEFQLEYITLNGYLMSRGIGNKDFYNDVDDEKPAKILNAFSDSTPTTFSVVYNNELIYNDARNASLVDSKPWLVFFQDYLYPTVSLSAEKIRKKADQSKAAERRKRRNSLYTRITEIAREGEDFKNSEAARRRAIPSEIESFYTVSANLVATGIDCDTAQAKLLKDALGTYIQFTKKKDFRNLVRQLIMSLRDEIVKDTAARNYLTTAIRFEENPQQSLREIERQVNQEIFCGLDVLGNVIETTFLDENDMNPKNTAGPSFPLIKNFKVDLSVPKGYKGTYKTLFETESDVFQAIVEKAVLGFIESLIAGIVKDVINAFLGCGPEDETAETLNDALRDLKFGVLDLNSYLEGIDLIEVAKSVDLVNVTRTNVDGEEQVTKEDPTNVQLMTLISDVSKMCTPREIDLLIFGAANNDLYQLILETVSDGEVRFPVNVNVDPNGEEQTEIRIINPEVYDKFEFTANKIRDFFAALGDTMREEGVEEIALLNISPTDAYCTTRDPDLGLDNIGINLSVDQLEQQYISIINSKKEKISAMCDLLQDLENIKLKIEEFINSIGLPEWYDKMLSAIQTVGDTLFTAFFEWINSLFGEETTNNSSEMFNIYMTRFGQELFLSVRDMISKRMMIPTIPLFSDYNRFVYYAPSMSRNRAKKQSTLILPYPPPEVIDDNSSWWWAGSLDDIRARKKDFESTYALRTAPETLRTRLLNVPRDGEDGYDNLYKILKNYKQVYHEVSSPDQWITNNASTQSAICTMTVESINHDPRGVQIVRTRKNPKTFETETKIIAEFVPSEGDQEPEEPSVDYYKMLSNMSSPESGGILGEGPRRRIIMPSRHSEIITAIINLSFHGLTSYEAALAVPNPLDTFGSEDVTISSDNLSVSNPSNFIDEQLNFIFTKDEGKMRFRGYMKGVISNLYQISDEECVNNKEAAIATSMVLMVQARLQRFFTNVVSLASPYPNWNSFGTRKLVTDYLFRKIYEEFEIRGLSNLIFEYADVFKKAFADEPDNNITLGEYDTPREFIKQLVEQVYLSMLKKASDSVYSSIIHSPYSRSKQMPRYERLLKKFYAQLLEAIDDGETFGLQNIQETAEFIRNEILDENGNPTETGFYYGNYYYPMGLFIGLYLITQDSLVNVSRNFGRTHYTGLSQEASYDDAFLSAVSEQDVTKFTSQLVGLPVNLIRRGSGVGMPDVAYTYYSRAGIANRLKELSVLTGIERESFIPHLQYFLDKRQAELLVLEQTIKDQTKEFALIVARDQQDNSLPGDQFFFLAYQESIPKVADNIQSNRIVIDFISKVLDGSLLPIEQVLLSSLSWFSLNDQSVALLQNSYNQFFESKIIPDGTIIEIHLGINDDPGFQQFFTDRPEEYGLKGYTSVTGVINKFISYVNKAYESDNYEALLKERSELQQI